MSDKIFGIDLGTTNSLIGYKDEYLSDMVKSIVNLKTGGVGIELLEDAEAERSFKVDMSMSAGGNIAVSASKHVLMELKRLAGKECKRVVISVPAYFCDNQRQATITSAKLAGLNVVALINEPTAAAMYVCRNRKSLTLVYDLGGGTFDVSLVDSRFGNYDVQSTDGLGKKGGDDLDKAIRQYLIKNAGVPFHHLDTLGKCKFLNKCTEIKIQIQKERKDLVLDLSEFQAGEFIFKENDYITLMKLTFMDTITKTRRVIASAIPDGERYDLVLVGGSTRCPYLREWLTKELGQVPLDIPYDPDKVVAQGAAMYAGLIETGKMEEIVSDITTALSIGVSDGTVRTIIEKDSKIPISEELMLSNNEASSKLQLDVFQGDSFLQSGNEKIGTMVYDYGEVKEAYCGDVVVTMTVDISGVITITVKEMLKEPVTVVLDRKR